MANKFKEQQSEEEAKVEVKPEVKPEKESKVIRSVANVVSGSFLSKETMMKNFPFVFFLSFLAICYIANGFYSDDQIRKVNRLSGEVKELRTQYIVIKDSLVIKSKQTEVAKVLSELNTGIKESVVPPKKILIKSTSLSDKE